MSVVFFSNVFPVSPCSLSRDRTLPSLSSKMLSTCLRCLETLLYPCRVISKTWKAPSATFCMRLPEICDVMRRINCIKHSCQHESVTETETLSKLPQHYRRVQKTLSKSGEIVSSTHLLFKRHMKYARHTYFAAVYRVRLCTQKAIGCRFFGSWSFPLLGKAASAHYNSGEIPWKLFCSGKDTRVLVRFLHNR